MAVVRREADRTLAQLRPLQECEVAIVPPVVSHSAVALVSCWVGMALVINHGCGGGWSTWSSWNPLAYYGSLVELSQSPWALMSGSVVEARRETMLALGAAAR